MEKGIKPEKTTLISILIFNYSRSLLVLIFIKIGSNDVIIKLSDPAVESAL